MDEGRSHAHALARSNGDDPAAASPAAVPGRVTASQLLPPGSPRPAQGDAQGQSTGPADPSNPLLVGTGEAAGAPVDPRIPAWVDEQLHVVLTAPSEDGDAGKAKQRLDMVLATVRALPPPARAALRARLEKPDPRDEIARLFQDRLAGGDRDRVIAALAGGGSEAGPAGAQGAADKPVAQGAADKPAVQPAVQKKERGSSAAPAGDVHEIASRGVSGASERLPHLDTIQRSFGAHDVTGVAAHTGEAARSASEGIGAQAYAVGNHVAFAGAPDLHTAAHEAAHVVQQRAGVQLKSGVGEAGDAYERHADAVADRVVAGGSAENLLGEMAPGGAAAAVQRREAAAVQRREVAAVQRREVATDAEITGTQDWTTADRVGNTARWQAACLHNLNAVDSRQYVKIVERRDFYKWFYEYTAARGYTTRWALAAHVVANGAHQIADMDATNALANDTFGIAGVELQGAMREGNQVIFDNVLPKLKRLLDGGPLRGRAALDWDKQVLAEEQTLIQPLYGSLSQQSLDQLNTIARKQGIPGFGAGLTGQDQLAPGTYNNGGTVPAFNQTDIRNVGDRWRYGMDLGNQFTPGGSGFNPATDTMPGVGASYQNGTEFQQVATRHNLHQLDAWLNPNRWSRMGPNSTGAATYLQSIVGQLTAFEKQQVLTDRSADGWAYSIQFAQFGFTTEAMVRQALPADPASAAAVNAFVGRFLAEQNRVRIRYPTNIPVGP